MDKIDKIGIHKTVLAMQHVLAMFGATVLVPYITGLNPSVALFSAGVGTLLFHFVTKGMVPVFLGSSFAFIPVIISVNEQLGSLRYAQGGIIIAGALYLIMALMVRVFGVSYIRSFFPPVVTGPMIVVIGLSLSPIAVEMASQNWIVAITVLLTVVFISTFLKGFFKLVPILIAIIVGYILSMVLGLVQFQPIIDADLFVFTRPDIIGGFFTTPIFDIRAISIIAPIVIVVFMEHIGDITTNGAVVGKDFIKNPGLHRTLMGDGLATIFAGLVGGPANTTYSENTGVLAVTKVYDPRVIRLAAVFAIVLSLIGKVGAILQTIPESVMGGISLMLFGTIASIGIRTISEANIDFTHNRNLVIVSLILVLGIGTDILARYQPEIRSGLQITEHISVSGLSLGGIAGIIANKVLPDIKNN